VLKVWQDYHEGRAAERSVKQVTNAVGFVKPAADPAQIQAQLLDVLATDISLLKGFMNWFVSCIRGSTADAGVMFSSWLEAMKRAVTSSLTPL